MIEPILYDSHMHTPLCNHARGEPEEYAAVAYERGLKGIIITCHNPGPEGWSPRVRMSLDQFDEYVAMVERAREAWHGRVDVRLGLESDYIPEMEDFLEDLHSKADFNHILGSVHPQLKYYKERYQVNDPFLYQQNYYNHLAMAAESGLFDTISHPDLVKNMAPKAWNVARLLDDIRRSLDRIARTGVAMELNTSGLHKRVREMNPGPDILAEMNARSIPVVVGSDAHEPHRVAADFDAAFDRLEEAGYTHLTYYLSRNQHTVAVSDARQSLLQTVKL